MAFQFELFLSTLCRFLYASGTSWKRLGTSSGFGGQTLIHIATTVTKVAVTQSETRSIILLVMHSSCSYVMALTWRTMHSVCPAPFLFVNLATRYQWSVWSANLSATKVKTAYLLRSRIVTKARPHIQFGDDASNREYQCHPQVSTEIFSYVVDCQGLGPPYENLSV
jgi:hypothetical protein